MDASKCGAIRFEASAGVAHVVLASPESGNGLTPTVFECLHRWVERAPGEGCRAVVLSAVGPEFCRGLDLERAFSDGPPSPEYFGSAAQAVLALCRCPLPVIACVDGPAMGGGVGLAAACDIVLASDRATFMLSEAIVGMIPSLITPLLARRLSASRIRYLALSTRGVSAAEAHSFGLGDELVPRGGMTAALDRQLQRIFRSSPRALAECKAHVTPEEGSIEDELERSQARLAAWFAHPEVLVGLQAFSSNKSPAWFQKYRRSRGGM